MLNLTFYQIFSSLSQYLIIAYFWLRIPWVVLHYFMMFHWVHCSHSCGVFLWFNLTLDINDRVVSVFNFSSHDSYKLNEHAKQTLIKLMGRFLLMAVDANSAQIALILNWGSQCSFTYLQSAILSTLVRHLFELPFLRVTGERPKQFEYSEISFKFLFSS